MFKKMANKELLHDSVLSDAWLPHILTYKETSNKHHLINNIPEENIRRMVAIAERSNNSILGEE